MPYADNTGAVQPAHPHSLISTFVVRCLASVISILAESKISSLQLVSEAEQVCLSHTWSQTLKTDFLVIQLIWPCATRVHVQETGTIMAGLVH